MLRAKEDTIAQIKLLISEIDTANKMLTIIPEEGMDKHGRSYVEDGTNLSAWISKAEDRLTILKKEPVKRTYIKIKRRGKTKEGLTYAVYRKKLVYRDRLGRFAKRPSTNG